jgi:hypothetical protein
MDIGIWLAAAGGDLARVQRLVGQEPRLLNAENGFKETPLLRASSRGHVRVVRWLVDQGAALDHQDSWGWTALSMAASKGHTRVVRLLMGKGADPTIIIGRVGGGGWTPLMQTSRMGHPDTVRCLLDHPSAAATINIRNAEGNTALLLACWEGYAGVVRVLLEKGANPTIADNMGRTAMATAKESKRRACIKALKVRCPSMFPLLTGLTEALGVVSAWRGGQEAERAYLLWKARQVADAAGGFAAPVMEGETPEEAERRRVEAVPEELRRRVAEGREGLPGVSVVAGRKRGEEWRKRTAVLDHVVQSLKPGVFEELMEMMG